MRTFFLRTCFAAFLAMSCSCTSNVPVAMSTVPDFTLPDLAKGQPVTFSEINRENPVLLVFWASWCPSCTEEIPEINKIQKRFSPAGLKVLSVNVQESYEVITRFQRRHEMSYPVLLDESGEIAEKFGLAGVPAAVLAQKGGQVLYFGFSLPENLDKLLQIKESTLV